jgi:hypothetical protein
MEIDFHLVAKESMLDYVPGQSGKAIEGIGWQDSPEVGHHIAIVIIVGRFYQIE